ncbi:MAG: hypothetical protein ACFE7E_02440 [Candidatus Hodarchaeota archaeon]
MVAPKDIQLTPIELALLSECPREMLLWVPLSNLERFGILGKKRIEFTLMGTIEGKKETHTFSEIMYAISDQFIGLLQQALNEKKAKKIVKLLYNKTWTCFDNLEDKNAKEIDCYCTIEDKKKGPIVGGVIKSMAGDSIITPCEAVLIMALARPILPIEDDKIGRRYTAGGELYASILTKFLEFLPGDWIDKRAISFENAINRIVEWLCVRGLLDDDSSEPTRKGLEIRSNIVKRLKDVISSGDTQAIDYYRPWLLAAGLESPKVMRERVPIDWFMLAFATLHMEFCSTNQDGEWYIIQRNLGSGSGQPPYMNRLYGVQNRKKCLKLIKPLDDETEETVYEKMGIRIR